MQADLQSSTGVTMVPKGLLGLCLGVPPSHIQSQQYFSGGSCTQAPAIPLLSYPFFLCIQQAWWPCAYFCALLLLFFSLCIFPPINFVDTLSNLGIAEGNLDRNGTEV